MARFGFRLLLCWLAVLVMPGLAVAQTANKTPSPTTVQGVTIPDLWDPNRRLDRPDAASIKGIRFATTEDFPPFNFLGSDGQLTGFNVDLARAICNELAVSCTIQSRPWDGLAETVAAGRIDAAIAGIAITDKSRATMDFSDVYLRPAARFVARRDGQLPLLTPTGLSEKRVAVIRGSAHQAYLDAFFPKSERVLVDTPAAAEEALQAGKADLVFGDGVQLAFWLQSKPAANCCGFVGGAYVEPRFFGQGLAIALPPDHAGLRRAIDWALDSLYDKGAFAELYLRYFPIGYF